VEEVTPAPLAGGGAVVEEPLRAVESPMSQMVGLWLGSGLGGVAAGAAAKAVAARRRKAVVVRRIMKTSLTDDQL
jgi:hypothetical protein